ncbi:MAG: hypothetical protein ABIL68_01160 [bacterium]
MKDFKERMRNHQIKWRKKYLPNIYGKGWQNGKSYEHILPQKYKIQNFYPEIQEDLFEYIKEEKIQPHTGIHNLLSSWVVCSNFYWPFKNEDGYKLLAQYLNHFLSLNIEKIVSIDLEYLDNQHSLSPSELLGEDDGVRGSGQTSPDLAIKFITSAAKRGILLIESKFTEHSFYQCSGYSKIKPGKPVNFDRKRCLDTKGILESDFKNCHLLAWNRKYWDILKEELNTKLYQKLKKCPMSSSCYQLFRQQALSKGYEKKYKISISCVFIDMRNEKLINSVCSTGLNSLPNGWQELFPNLPFYWLTHNHWFEFVKTNNSNGKWNNWITYIENRYIKME